MSYKCEYIPLTELLEFIVDNRGKTVPTSDGGIALIATNCIKNTELYPVFEKVRYVSQETYDTWFRSHPKPGDIIFVNKGTPGRVCLVPDPVDFCIAQDMMAFRVDKNKVYNKYLFSVLRSRAFQNQISNYHVGTMIPHFKKGDLDSLLIPIPSMRVQKSIGNSYFLFSNKIQLNNEMNKTLEEMAQALFKRWFVDFEFPNEDGEPYKSTGGEMIESELGMIPKGWNLGKLSDLVNIKYGKDHKKLKDGNIPVFGSGGIMRYVDKALYEKESVLIPRKGTLNNVMYVNEPFWSVDTMFFTEMKLPNIAKFVYQFLKAKDLANMNIGSAVPSMTTAILNAMNIVIPNQEILDKFNDAITAFYTQIEFNDNNSRNLVSIRDSLLPKLMSGEIKIEDIEANL